MAVLQAEFAVPVVPSTGTSSVLPNSHRSTASLTSVRHGSPANAEASSSKRRLDMDSSFRQRANGKKVERRVLPARIASSNTNAGSNTTSASRELDDMVMECFAKAFLETYQPSETVPVMITTEPISTLHDSLLPSNTVEPQWWNGEFSSFRRSTEIKQKRAPQAALRPSESIKNVLTPSPEKQRAPLSTRTKSTSEAPLSGPSPISNSPRGLRARGLVQYTDSAVLKHEPMDTSDEFYARLHRKHEMGEKKDKLRETDKMVQARNKLKARIELLESAEEHVWFARIEKLLKKAARYAGDDDDEKSDTGESDSGSEARDRGKSLKRGEMTEDELAEKVQRLVLLAGIELVKRKSAEQLKEELIAEGKELLQKYNKTLGIRGGRYLLKAEQGVRNMHSDAEDVGRSRTARQLSTEVEKSETPEVDIHKVDSKRKRRRIEVSHDSDSESLSPNVDFEPLPIDAAARSDGESVYEEGDDTKPKKKQSERKTSSRRAALMHTTTSAPVILEPPRERIYLPVTASGLPVLIEAADKRLAILKAEAEKKRLEDEAKSKRKRAPEMRSRSNRVLAAPFGMPMPDSVAFHNEYDLDGPFWIPYLKARQEGGFTLDSMNVYPGVGNQPGATLPPHNAIPGQAPVLPTATAVGELPAEHIINDETSHPLTDLSPTPDLRGDTAVSQTPDLPTLSPRLSIAPPTEELVQSREMEVITVNPHSNTQDDEYPPSDIVPDSQPASDAVPSSWRTEEAVPSSAG